MVTIKNGKIYVDEDEILICSGAVHYFRTFPEQWRDRLYKLKMMGLNTVETYCCWNMHEPEEGNFCFDGMLDLERFIKTAQDLGLYVIIRPGPYICSEWDLGGLPAWLLKDDSIRLRSCDGAYFDKAAAYMRVLMTHIVPYLQTNGGNIILTAVENEYGSFANSRRYMNRCAQLIRDCGVDVPLFTSDGHTAMTLNAGTADDVLPGLDFGLENGLLDHHTEVFRELYPDKPVLHAEHWIGGTVRWKQPVPEYPDESVVKEVKQQLEAGIHNNFYMFHGGTNFGFYNGANNFTGCCENRMKTSYWSDSTTYDCNAPLNEYGDITQKYKAIQRVMSEYLGINLTMPERVETQTIGDVRLERAGSLFDNLGNIATKFTDEFPRNMEHYDQCFGYILYRCTISSKQPVKLLAFERVYDRIHVYFNGIQRGIIERNDDKQYIESDGWMDEGGVLELLVENQGRVNFGPDMLLGERKGICGYVYISDPVGIRQILTDWEIYTLPMTGLERLTCGKSDRFPAFFKGSFKAENKKDCFIHFDHFTKGFVVVNGFNLGRFWNVGPQLSVYLPWPLLRDINEIIVFEEEKNDVPVVSIRDYHIIGNQLCSTAAKPSI